MTQLWQFTPWLRWLLKTGFSFRKAPKPNHQAKKEGKTGMHKTFLFYTISRQLNTASYCPFWMTATKGREQEKSFAEQKHFCYYLNPSELSSSLHWARKPFPLSTPKPLLPLGICSDHFLRNWDHLHRLGRGLGRAAPAVPVSTCDGVIHVAPCFAVVVFRPLNNHQMSWKIHPPS